MSINIVGKPFGGFKLSESDNELLKRLDHSTVSICKLDSTKEDRLYGFIVNFNIHEYDLEDSEDLKEYMRAVPDFYTIHAIPIGEISYVSVDISIDKTILQTNSDTSNAKRFAIVLIGADGSIWVNDKMSVSKASGSLSDFLLADPKVHYDAKYDLTFDF